MELPTVMFEEEKKSTRKSITLWLVFSISMLSFLAFSVSTWKSYSNKVAYDALWSEINESHIMGTLNPNDGSPDILLSDLSLGCDKNALVAFVHGDVGCWNHSPKSIIVKLRGVLTEYPWEDSKEVKSFRNKKLVLHKDFEDHIRSLTDWQAETARPFNKPTN